MYGRRSEDDFSSGSKVDSKRNALFERAYLASPRPDVDEFKMYVELQCNVESLRGKLRHALLRDARSSESIDVPSVSSAL